MDSQPLPLRYRVTPIKLSCTMKNKRFFLTPESAYAAQAYLLRKCRHGSEIEFLQRGAKTDQAFANAVAKFRFDDKVTLDIDLRNFSKLCIDNLTDEQWLKLRTAIRVKRKKEKTSMVSVDVTAAAHQALKRLAQQVGPELSMSQAILEIERQFKPSRD